MAPPHNTAHAPAQPAFAERTRDHLYAIVHRWPGTCQAHEQVQPPEQSLARGEDARDVLALGYLADLRLRFVFAQPGTEAVALARASDLARLGLTPHQALALATLHLRKAAGIPHLHAQANGTYLLQAAHAMLLESHLLDRNFWRGLLERFPQGVVVAMPRRGWMALAPADDNAAQAQLFEAADAGFAAAGPQQLSGCLLHFDQTGWRLHVRLPSALKPARRQRKRRAEGKPQSTANLQPAEDAHGRAIPSVDDSQSATGARTRVRAPQKTQPLDDSLLVTTGMQCMLAATAMFLLAALLWSTGSMARMGPSQAIGVTAASLGAVGAVRRAYGTGALPTTALLYAVVSFTPGANAMLWAWLTFTGLRALRAAGWRPTWRTLLP